MNSARGVGKKKKKRGRQKRRCETQSSVSKRSLTKCFFFPTKKIRVLVFFNKNLKYIINQ